MKNRKLQTGWAVLSLVSGLTLACSSQEGPKNELDAYYSNRPKVWFDEVGPNEYFNPSATPSWQLNETCDDSGALSIVSYNIFHNVPFVTDFGDEMEQSLGEVTRCADILLFQEAWDYDDIIGDGPRSDLVARGYSMLTPTGQYCDDSLGAIENDCSGLVMFYKRGTRLMKELGFRAFTTSNGPDVHKEKGVWGAIFSKEGRYYYVFNTHLTYGTNGHLEGDTPSDNSRISNMKQSLGFIEEAVTINRASYPPALVILGGDLNADFDAVTRPSRGHQLLEQASASAAFFEPADYRYMDAVMSSQETVGFKSNWVGTAVDTGPNGMASGATGDLDAVLLGKPGHFGTCPFGNIQYSGWAPVWMTLDSGQRKWPYYTHSDHYGRWLKVTPDC
ncbi:endonuclease [Archangium lansingense]|uniref:endonuclease n=1 Tax=Archangium lansingense TaxID=2995310 RepID=UPI003B817EEC